MGLAVLAVLPLAGCARAEVAQGRLEAPAGPVLRWPGMTLVAGAERRAALAGAPAAAEALCGAPDLRLRTWPPPGPLAPIGEHATDTRVNPFAWLAMRAGAAAFGVDDAEARAALILALDRWARAGALRSLKRPDAATFYGVNRVLLPTIVSWSLVRDAPEASPALRRRVEAWLGGLVARSWRRHAELRPEEVTARNNHAYLLASVLAAWGALAGDRAAFAFALAVYRQALADMRPDGSLPLETARGARALWYQRHALASLVTIAELAAVQGYDLYGQEVEGRSLHAGVRFLLDGIEDPARVRPYAEANTNPGPAEDWRHQDLGFLERRGHGRHYMAWVEAYAARFPNRDETRRLLRLLFRDGDPRPLVDEYAGGNLSCLMAPLDPRAPARAQRDPGPGSSAWPRAAPRQG